MLILHSGFQFFKQNNLYNIGASNSGSNVISFQSFDDREQTFNNGTGIYINDAEIVVANIRARSLRGDEQVQNTVNLYNSNFKFCQ